MANFAILLILLVALSLISAGITVFIKLKMDKTKHPRKKDDDKKA